MNIFESPRETVLDGPPFKKAILIPVDDLEDDFLQMISQDFRDNFEAAVEQC